MATNTVESSLESSIDIWWHNESNGNFMLILAYIINQYRRIEGKAILPLRLLHYLDDNTPLEQRQRQLSEHLKNSRLEGKVQILPKVDNKDVY